MRERERAYNSKPGDTVRGLIFAGGKGKDKKKILNSVEMTKDAHNFRSLEHLPVGSEGGCLVIIDSKRLFATGGHSREGARGQVIKNSKVQGCQISDARLGG